MATLICTEYLLLLLLLLLLLDPHHPGPQRHGPALGSLRLLPKRPHLRHRGLRGTHVCKLPSLSTLPPPCSCFPLPPPPWHYLALPSQSGSPPSLSRQISVCPESGCGLPIGGEEEDLLSSNTSVADMMSPINVIDRIEEDQGYQGDFLYQYRCCNVCCPW